jgi:hypothetical protein
MPPSSARGSSGRISVNLRPPGATAGTPTPAPGTPLRLPTELPPYHTNRLLAAAVVPYMETSFQAQTPWLLIRCHEVRWLRIRAHPNRPRLCASNQVEASEASRVGKPVVADRGYFERAVGSISRLELLLQV